MITRECLSPQFAFQTLFFLEAMENMTAKEIFRIKNSTKNILRSLKLLGSPVDHWDDIIVFLIVGKLSSKIQRRWEEQVAKSERPTIPHPYATLDSFLEGERLAAVQLESSRFAAIKAEHSSIHKKKIDACHKKDLKVFHKSQELKSKMSSYFICKGSHFVSECELFLSKPPDERRKLISSLSRCLNCFGQHKVYFSKNPRRCKSCDAKHHSLLYFNNFENRKTEL